MDPKHVTGFVVGSHYGPDGAGQTGLSLVLFDDEGQAHPFLLNPVAFAGALDQICQTAAEMQRQLRRMEARDAAADR